MLRIASTNLALEVFAEGKDYSLKYVWNRIQFIYPFSRPL